MRNEERREGSVPRWQSRRGGGGSLPAVAVSGADPGRKGGQLVFRGSHLRVGNETQLSHVAVAQPYIASIVHFWV